MRTLRVDAQDALVPGSVTDFAQDLDGPVDIEMGPDGLLYYVAITANEVRRIRYTAGNTRRWRWRPRIRPAAWRP